MNLPGWCGPPQCKPDGSFEEVQCCASTGKCSCVDREGKKVEGTEQNGKPDCERKICKMKKLSSQYADHFFTSLFLLTFVFIYYFLAAHTTKCEKSRLDALANGPLPGKFVPHCKDDGSYEPAQCWASTGYCWCVDENGEKKDGSTVRFKHPGCL